MFKYKKIIIVFSLMLSVLFLNTVNITSVLCEEDEEEPLSGPNFTNGMDTGFDYNIFNNNIIPFFINEETGIGWYYTGWVPEVTFEEGYYEDIDVSDMDMETIIDYIVNYNVGEEIKKKNGDEYAIRDLYVALNTAKTHLYYWDGNTLELFPNGSRLYVGNDSISGYNYVENICNFIKVKQKNVTYTTLYNNFLQNNYKFMNYVFTKSTDWRFYDILFGSNYIFSVYPEWLNYELPYTVSDNGDTTLYSYNQYVPVADGLSFDYSITSTFESSYYYSTGNNSIKEMYQSFFDYDKDGKYTDEDYLLFKYKISTSNIHVGEGDLLISFDFYNTVTKKYERIYTTYTELLDQGLIDEDLVLEDSIETYQNDINSQVMLKIIDIKNLCHLGDTEDIIIQGIGISWSKENDNIDQYDGTIKTYSFTHDISNSCYCSFNFENTTQNTIPNIVKVYRLQTSCTSWVRNYVSSPINTEDTPVSDGKEGNIVTTDLTQGGDFLKSLINRLSTFFEFVKYIFLNIPQDLQYCIYISVFTLVFIMLIKFLRG